MSFKIVLSDNSVFKEAFEAISSIVDEIVCIIDSDGFRVTAMDRSHISFVNLDLKPTLFDEFECEVPEKITIDTSEFIQVLKRMKKTDIFSLTCDEGNVIIGLKGDVTREFKIRLIDIEYESPQPPHIEYPVSISDIPSDLVKDAINDMELFSDKLNFVIDEDYLRIESDGEFGTADVKYLHGGDVTELAEACFAIPKLKEMFKASKFSKDLTMNLGTDMPLTLKFILPGNDGELSFLLAPRLNQDE